MDIRKYYDAEKIYLKFWQIYTFSSPLTMKSWSRMFLLYQHTWSVLFCFSRASTSSSLDGVCAVINNACALLETDFCEVLKQQLRQGYPSGYLDLTQAYNVLHTSIQQGRLQTSDSEQARLMFLVSFLFVQNSVVP
jgi:hypothetical protein